ncbi:MAG: 50S ribosomal protein L31 [Alphaproteobacteria bacterium]|nr:50S ribosomal protein L31 [Alphaproteobacteria bacterium]
MKKEIHTPLNPVIFRDRTAQVDFSTFSTLTTDVTEEINGVKHYVIAVEISSASHPFYTKKDHVIDTAGRVDRFKAKLAKRKKTDSSAQ